MNIQVERIEKVVKITLDRPERLNALNQQTLDEIIEVMQPLDKDPSVGCFIITGAGKAFAAGADIKEMGTKSYMDMFHQDYFAGWESFTNIRTPKIAAINGYALGGGCELAMMCDILYASETAIFGQPEIKLGVIPGIGGTQRLTKLIGKSKAMELILTGKTITAHEAEHIGLVSRIFKKEELIPESIQTAITISNYSKTTVMVAKEMVDRALELGLREGILFERRAFHALFATKDQKEGMAAFLEKRPANFQNNPLESINL